MPQTSRRAPVLQPSTEHRSFSVPALPPIAERWSLAQRRPQWRPFLRAGIVAALAISGVFADAAPTASTSSSGAAAIDRFADFVTEASQRFGVPIAWIRAVMRVESAGEPRATSPRGAMGLMQLMPQTWAALRLRYGLGVDPYDAHDNILAGSAYLRELWDRYGAPGFLAAYNAGPARYEDHLATGRPLPTETQVYVAKLAPVTSGGSVSGVAVVVSVARSWTEAPLFATPVDGSPAKSLAPSEPQTAAPRSSGIAGDRAALASRSDGLFVALSGQDSRP